MESQSLIHPKRKTNTMRTLHILIFSLIWASAFAQEPTEQEVESSVNEVTVFLDGAQVVRTKSVDLAKGKTILKFVNLSPFIDAKSIQAKANGMVTILSVNHQKNYLSQNKKDKNIDDLEEALELVEDKIQLENTHLSIISEELEFLQINKYIGGKNDQVNITNLKDASEFYGNKLTALKLKSIERNKTIKELNAEKNKLQNQINTLSSKKDFPTGEILVKIDAEINGKFSIELSYLVGNAGWFPSYDIRAKNINEPVQLIYKANVKQDTKVDWKNVKLKFSSSEPNVSGIAPQLKTYFLNYNSFPPVYKLSNNSVSGRVMDSKGEPLIGVMVSIPGSTIAAITDFDGHYSITVPNSASQISYSFIGFKPKTLSIYGSTMNVALQEEAMALDEVAVVGYGTRKKEALQGKVAGVSVANDKIRIRGSNSMAIPTAQVEKQTAVDFEIDVPYTINSDNKNYSVDMTVYNLPAFYQYYSVPKIDKDAFLIANIVDWEKYNLLEGEANVFFEETYVGKTLLDVRFAKDTLEISLGRDKMVTVNREKIKDYTSRQFIGSKKEESRAWKITVKNNKSQDINMIILDQIPVSTREDIEVNEEQISGAEKNNDTGELKWKFNLPPGDKEEIDLKYSVKYPKNRNLIIE